MRLGALCLVMSGSIALLHADFSFEQTSKITGGSMVRMMKMVPGGGKALEPVMTTNLVKGNRMATVTDRAIHIIDVDKETMTDIDLEKKTYAVITFEEFRQALAAMEKKMAQQMKQGESEISFKMDVKDTGEKKTIQSLPTNLMKMLLEMEMKDKKSGQTAAMQINTDMWMAKSVAGYAEVKEFHKRFAEKIGTTPEMMRMGRMMLSQPGMGEGMAKMMKESAKLEGVPVMQVMRMMGTGGAYAGMGDMPEVKMPTAGEVGESAGKDAARSAGGRFGGLAGAAAGGMLGGFGRKKKEAPKEEAKPPAEQPPAAAKPEPGAPGTLMEMTTEMTGFSSGAVDATKFAVPAGFKEVEHDMKKAARDMK